MPRRREEVPLRVPTLRRTGGCGTRAAGFEPATSGSGGQRRGGTWWYQAARNPSNLTVSLSRRCRPVPPRPGADVPEMLPQGQAPQGRRALAEGGRGQPEQLADRLGDREPFLCRLRGGVEDWGGLGVRMGGGARQSRRLLRLWSGRLLARDEDRDVRGGIARRASAHLRGLGRESEPLQVTRSVADPADGCGSERRASPLRRVGSSSRTLNPSGFHGISGEVRPAAVHTQHPKRGPIRAEIGETYREGDREGDRRQHRSRHDASQVGGRQLALLRGPEG